MMLTHVVAAVSADNYPILAAAGDLTDKASRIGQTILAATVVLALVAAFFSTQQRRWVVVGTILLIGGFLFMVIGNPTAVLTQLGDAIKGAVWDPILGEL